jgi:hypothetical protein
MLLAPDTPNEEEWLALLAEQPDIAADIIEALRTQLKQPAWMREPAVDISLQDYERASRLFEQAQSDSAVRAKLAPMIARGRLTMAPPPNQADWQQMIADDPAKAKALYLAFKKKEAMLGLATPRALVLSLKAYETLISSKADASSL